jgi:hypothetical protein
VRFVFHTSSVEPRESPQVHLPDFPTFDLRLSEIILPPAISLILDLSNAELIRRRSEYERLQSWRLHFQDCASTGCRGSG